MRLEHPAAKAKGFALVTILLLSGIAGLLAVAVLRDARFAQALSNTLHFQHRAFVLAEAGIADALARLQQPEPAVADEWTTGTTPDGEDTTQVGLHPVATSHLPLDHSVGRFVAHHFEIHATSRTAGNARALHVRGAIQLLPVRAIEPDADCLPVRAIPLRVMIEPGTPPTQVELHGGSQPALFAVDPATGDRLWSMGAESPATQNHGGMDAGFAGSLTALDMDGDGLHDRLYAGDLAGRIWRIDLRHGAGAAHWAAASVFADLGAGARGFIAPPDLSLSAPPGADPWLNIAIGTASMTAGADNRFYVLRDTAVFDHWPEAEHAQRTPIRESALTMIGAAATAGPNAAGYYLQLGNEQVFTPPLTVASRITVPATSLRPSPASDCQVPMTLRTLQVVSGEADPRFPPIATRMQTAPFSLEAQPDGSALCHFGTLPVPACDLRKAARATWWRIEEPQ